MSARVDVAVVVATHNRVAHLEQLLDALERQTVAADRMEIVVVDDGSIDGTAELLATRAATGRLPLRHARHPRACGPAAARNRGWRMTSAALIAFTDDDCEPTEGWLDALMTLAAARPRAIVQGKTLPNPAELHAMDAFAKTLTITGPSPHFQTCNIIYPRSVLEQLGGFDESFPAPTGEDTDLGWRALGAGVVQLFAPDALVYHAVHARTPRDALKDALLASEDLLAYKLNPALRAILPQGRFYDRAHPLLLQALFAAWLTRRRPEAAAFCLPYLLNLRSRCAASRSPLYTAAYFAMFDAVQVAATLRGAVRHRLVVL